MTVVRPILFSGPMVNALLDGRKTQTRRIITKLLTFGSVTEFGKSDTPGYDWHFRDKAMRWHDIPDQALRQSYMEHAPGVLLYVRETWRAGVGYDGVKPSVMHPRSRVWFEADGEPEADLRFSTTRRPNIYMPRWASRITLRVAEVRIEPVQQITTADILAEGAPVDPNYRSSSRDHSAPPMVRTGPGRWQTTSAWFHRLWDGLNAKRGFGWDANPWVAAVSFEVIRENVDAVLAREAAA